MSVKSNHLLSIKNGIRATARSDKLSNNRYLIEKNKDFYKLKNRRGGKNLFATLNR